MRGVRWVRLEKQRVDQAEAGGKRSAFSGIPRQPGGRDGSWVKSKKRYW